MNQKNESLYQVIKRVFILEGKGVSSLLLGISSQTRQAPQTAFLDKKGKVIVTCDQISLGSDKQLFVIEKSYAVNFIQHIIGYLKLHKVEMRAIPAYVYQVFSDNQNQENRVKEDFYIPQKKGWLIISQIKKECKNQEDLAYIKSRLDYEMPRQGLDYEHPILNFIDQEQQYYSLNKGCFLGQEIISRICYRGKISDKITVGVFKSQQEAQEKGASSIIYDREIEKYRGFIFKKLKN